MNLNIETHNCIDVVVCLAQLSCMSLKTKDDKMNGLDKIRW